MSRLVAWNILEGLRAIGIPFCSEIEDEGRRRAATGLVKKLDPDVLVLNEALYCCPYGGTVHNYRALFGIAHGVCQLYDGPWGNAILSRFPIVEERSSLIYEADSAQNRGAIAARISFPEGEAWVATLHPHPRRGPVKRAADLDAFLQSLKGAVILAGDMNALSPEDETDTDELVRAFERFSPPGEAQEAVRRFIDAGRMIFEEVLPRYGMRDAMPHEARAATMPTRMLGTGNGSDMRIDHILTSSHIRTDDAGIERDELADTASDHYPVRLDFDIEAA